MAKDIWDMDDNELKEAFDAAKAELDSPNTQYEEEASYDSDEYEEEEQFMEQPDDQDSDDDASSEDEEEEESEEDSEPTEEDADEDPSDEEEQTETEEDESEEDEQPVDTLEEFFGKQSKVRANGVDYTFSNKEKLEMFDKMFPQATDYTKKMQALKPYRQRIDYMQQIGMSDQEFNFLMDISKGDKSAITELLKRTGIDALELDTENNNYVAKAYGRDETELDIKDVVDEISNDKEYTVTYNVLNSQWDDNSRSEFVKDPKMIKQLHEDVKSGMFDIVNPRAQKLKMYDGGKASDLDYYKAAARQYFGELEQQQTAQRLDAQRKQQAADEAAAAELARVNAVKAKQAKQVTIAKESQKRKAAAPTSKKAGTKNTNYLDDLNENYDDWYLKLQEKM